MLKLKMTPPLMAAVVASIIGLAGASSIASQGVPKSSLQCGLEIHQQANYVRLKGWVGARRTQSGTYEMRIHKTSGGGSSTIRQSGDFSLDAGDVQTLSTSVMNGSKSNVKAELSILWKGQKMPCAEGDAPSSL